MLNIKIAYNSSNDNSSIKDLLYIADTNPIFDTYDENDFKEIKKAWKVKGAAAAREVPFIGVFKDDKLIKAFYKEDESANDKTFFEWFEQYITENAKKGHMKIIKLSGNNNERYQPGAVHEGDTNTFIEGTALYLTSSDKWFHTSVIESIDWEARTFKTLNSTYAFKLNESTSN